MRDLHRVEAAADWDKVPESQHNFWQRLAKRTNGNITPGNVTSVLGAVLSLSAARDIWKENYGRATVKLFFGRVLDMADGGIAHATGTKSPKGEALDAGLDKALAATIGPLMNYKNLIPSQDGYTIIAQQGISAGLSTIGLASGRRMHPSQEGKEQATADWVRMGSGLLERVLEDHNQHLASAGFNLLGQTAMSLSQYACAPVAIRGYATELLTPIPQVDQQG